MNSLRVVRQRAAKVIAAFESKSPVRAFEEDGGSHRHLVAIAECCFKLTVAANYDLPQDIAGHLDSATDSIGFNPGLDETQKNFVIAHELGHRELGHPDHKHIDSAAELDDTPDPLALTVQNGVYRTYNAKTQAELEANVFAIELLAPLQLVKQRMLANPEWTVAGLASYFGISETAMVNQIVASLLPATVDREDPSRAEPEVHDLKHDEAVLVPAPALVLAGPGTGKTRVLVRRYARMVNELGVPPRQILALTFSNRAAEELRERLIRRLSPELHPDVRVMTFHSFGHELLKEFGPSIGLKVGHRLITPAGILSLLKKNLGSLPMGSLEDLRNPPANLGLLIDAISRAKDELASPQEFNEAATKWLDDLRGSRPEDEKELVKHLKKEGLATRAIDASEFYEAYEGLLDKQGFVDFGDLIALSIQVLQSSAGDQVRDEYRHILVDEFQDINYASGRMLVELDGGRGVTWAVGDLKQSIYRFRGASPMNVLRFPEDYPGANTVKLGTCYRSFEDIVKAGEAVAVPARGDGLTYPDNILSAHRGRGPEGPSVKVEHYQSREDELEGITRNVAGAAKSLGHRNVAVLCRTRGVAEQVSRALEHAGIKTSWPGDLQEAPAFRAILAMLYLSCSDLRGLAPLAEPTVNILSSADLATLYAAMKEHGPSAKVLLYAARDGKIPDISDAGKMAIANILRCVGEMSGRKTATGAIAVYLFGHAKWLRPAIGSQEPSDLRTVGAVAQLYAIARQFSQESAGDENQTLHFLEFLETSVQANQLNVIMPDLDSGQSVSILTVHGSKGLEWPIVHVPFLAARRFPDRSWHEPIPFPPSLIRGGDHSDEDAEEACLFYVAITRARDSLTLSVADKYGRSEQPSPFVTDLVAKLQGAGRLEFIHVPSISGAVDMEEASSVPLNSENERISFSEIRDFEWCPKQYELQYLIGLPVSDRGYPKFHGALYEAMKWAAEQISGGMTVTADDAEAKLNEVWEKRGPTGHYYEARYYASALQAIKLFAERLRPGVKMQLRQEFELVIDDLTLIVTVDEVEQATSTTLRRHHFGRKSESHLGKKTDHLPALMHAIGEDKFASGFDVVAHYPLSGEDRSTDPGKTIIKNRKTKMKKLASDMKQGVYPPTPGFMTCRTCSYGLICPFSSNEPVAEPN